ncbi:hypothetical protein QAD02_000577 [Eretmocerus hayati]|uniref:Uncharacterized protein n=1 Tax=Eretmocerus hayati TaxID=131215 RepID=A0ACC2NEV2_9HYME|nr:hypothetical protein QAD02_000577 [Eretmocerus hayati]
MHPGVYQIPILMHIPDHRGSAHRRVIPSNIPNHVPNRYKYVTAMANPDSYAHSIPTVSFGIHPNLSPNSCPEYHGVYNQGQIGPSSVTYATISSPVHLNNGMLQYVVVPSTSGANYATSVGSAHGIYPNPGLTIAKSSIVDLAYLPNPIPAPQNTDPSFLGVNYAYR